MVTKGNIFCEILGYELIYRKFRVLLFIRMQGHGLIVMNLGGLFCNVSGCGYIFRKFRAFFVKVCGAWVNCCRAWVCKKCMDRGLVIIKLPERWLDRESYRKITGEVA